MHTFFQKLLSGTADFGIKVQKEDAVLWETVENAPIIVLHALPERQFAYATRLDGNGTLGVYDSGRILWRIKVRIYGMNLKNSSRFNNKAKYELIFIIQYHLFSWALL